MSVFISPTRSANAVSWRIAVPRRMRSVLAATTAYPRIRRPSYDLQGMKVSDAQGPGSQTGTSERRPIRVLFADIAGSTAIAERLDPEDWTTLVSEAFQRMNHTVERYGGTIARLMGDGLLAFFGAPTAHEDDPERAVRCGLDLVRAIDVLDASKHLSKADTFKVRVGINTGPVVVGVVGTEAAYDDTAMGDIVDVADRMQASADPDNVLAHSATY